jgi:hypothetical protein
LTLRGPYGSIAVIEILSDVFEGPNRLANNHEMRLRQSYVRVAKRAAMMVGRYAHAKQFNHRRRELRILRTVWAADARHRPQDRWPSVHRGVCSSIAVGHNFRRILAWLICASS